MVIKALSYTIVGPTVVIRLRCPECRHQGTFEPFAIGGGTANDVHIAYFALGQRRCPNPACLAHIFHVCDLRSQSLVVSYPAERIDFDATNIPNPVLTALEEAITCHANQCFVAAALMVRKTLEELCRDRGASGASLKGRITALGTKIVLPKELLDGLDDLRLLGNEAAHVESRDYDAIGKDEVEVAIDFTKEVLKATYQHAALLDKLRALKKSP